jgi:hypothetical protein
MLVGAVVAHCSPATWAHEDVFDTAGGCTAIHAGQSDCPTLNGSLAGPVTFRDDPHFAAELLGWHGAKLYRGRRWPPAQAREIVTDGLINATCVHART